MVKVVRAEIAPDKALLLQRTHPSRRRAQFRDRAARRPTEVAIVSLRRRAQAPGAAEHDARVLEDADQRRVERIDTDTELRVAKRHLDKLDLARMPWSCHAVVEAHEAGLLLVDGELKERLPPGRHAFWQVGRTVKITKVDIRPRRSR